MNECENQNDWSVKFLSSGPLGPLYTAAAFPPQASELVATSSWACIICVWDTPSLPGHLLLCLLTVQFYPDKHFGFRTITERPVNTKEKAAWVGYNSKPLGVSDLWESDPAPTEIRGRLSMDLNGTVVRPHARARACRAVDIGSDGKGEPSFP